MDDRDPLDVARYYALTGRFDASIAYALLSIATSLQQGAQAGVETPEHLLSWRTDGEQG